MKLEKENFRVNSSGWKVFTNHQEIAYLENPDRDIWEYVNGVPIELLGEQLFTKQAAIRETKKVGKRMPTNDEFSQFRKKDFVRIIYAGYRSTDGYFDILRTLAYFWSSSASEVAWKCFLCSTNNFTISRFENYHVGGFSVRCLKN